MRSATEADAGRIAEIHIASWKSAYRGLLPDEYLAGLSTAQARQRWQDYLAFPDRAAFVAEASERLIGFITAGPARDKDMDASIGEIYALYIHPAHWRRGIGSSLQLNALEYLVQAGFHRVVLWVLEGNQSARLFYEHSGWMPDGNRKTQIRDGIPCPEVRYARSLP